MDYLVWALTISLMLIGLIGTIAPVLPGTFLILAAAFIHKLLLPASISWTAFAWIAGFFVFSVIADIGCTLLGTRLFGGTRWGMAGAGGGALVGMFISLPALILGAIFGAIAAEKFGGRRSHRDALRSGAGAAFGFVLSTVARIGCAIAMIGLFVASAMYAT